MRRVLVIGGNGSGKTTFSKKLAAITGLPLCHLDRLSWHGNWQTVPRDEFDKLLQAELEKDRWIIDGNYNRSIPHRLKYCDTVFYFDFSTVSCLWGVTRRVICNYGRTRDDMGGNCPERFDLSFMKNILTFNKKHRKRYHRLLSDATGVTVVIFNSRRQAKSYLRSLPDRNTAPIV